MPKPALQVLPSELEKALQLSFEPVAVELRTTLLHKLLALAVVADPADESFRLHADALVETLLANLSVSLQDAVTAVLLNPPEPPDPARQEALSLVLTAMQAQNLNGS